MAILQQCSQFVSQESLAAVFITDLVLTKYTAYLPEASDPNSRVDKVTAYLLMRGREEGIWIFVLFLQALARRQPENSTLRQGLQDLATRINSELQGVNVIEIPFAIMSMNEQEALQLLNGEAFTANVPMLPNAQQRFEEFRELLSRQGLSDLSPSYASLRDNWRPHISPNQPIRLLVEQVFTRFFECYGSLVSPMLKPAFYSDQFFSTSRDERWQIQQVFRNSGGIIIVDAVSLMHPNLRHMLDQSMVASHDKVAVLIVAPISSSGTEIKQWMEREAQQQFEQMFRRFDYDLDHLCEIDIDNIRSMQRWMFRFFLERANLSSGSQPDPSKRMAMRALTNAPSGAKNPIFGGGQ